MVKAKRKQLAAIAAEKDSMSSDNSWVVVKKQKITILVPPSSPVQPPPQSSRMKRVPTKGRKTAKSRHQIMAKRHYKRSWSKQRKSTTCPFKEEIQFVGGGSKALDINNSACRPGLTNQLPKSTFKTAPEGSDLLVCANFPATKNKHMLRTGKFSETLVGAFRPPNRVLEARDRQPSSSFATLNHQDLPLHIIGEKGTFFERSFSCLNVGALQNQKMRALNIERKLERAGGLSRWLVSQGLGQFIPMFQRENVDKIQLLNLTMHKLKDMGADAVGPRRKLIHAIDCLCQPYFSNVND
ncbi:uncharacterized protein LOC131253149 [Magnolia sinica]|uniref:uncharacterized protein LOC131253149 n=1 Tax=Magnolia sinica TaxID=86752 RepID=UPI00265A1D61|nr:uncharacterized protein LOC131253149 [Magnolia sinica]XP_058109987.1 uncharacterized protein LOC131253149 [Magnolia sinica]XP_058109988.1 uncharacterized protein LOC131253149 [Magnolia sinica]XP_058109989.1 uncharacterized protein LOC131253149 [Magnolia sinica]